jgi:NTE family protein
MAVEARPAPRVGLVLGAGGTVGLAYHSGVLRALEQVGGFAPDQADIVVGTSAGSVIGAYLRCGWSTEDLWGLAMGTHPVLSGLTPEEVEARRAELFTPSFRSVPDFVRRGLGSAFVLARTLSRLPAPPAPGPLRHLFPGGLFDMTEGHRRFNEDLPLGWPTRPLWLCAVDIVSGRRVVLGRRGAPFASLHEGVMASCAIPGFYRPVQVGNMTLVDGGAHSTSNLDVVAKANCDLIVASVPLAWDTSAAPCGLYQLPRRFAARRLSNEVAEARSRGARVLLFRPGAPEVAMHGLNFMRRQGWEAVATMAYDAAARTLDTPRFRSALGDLAA